MSGQCKRCGYDGCVCDGLDVCEDCSNSPCFCDLPIKTMNDTPTPIKKFMSYGWCSIKGDYIPMGECVTLADHEAELTAIKERKEYLQRKEKADKKENANAWIMICSVLIFIAAFIIASFLIHEIAGWFAVSATAFLIAKSAKDANEDNKKKD